MGSRVIWATILGWGKTALGFFGGAKTWLLAGAAVAAVVGYLWIQNGRLAAQRDLARRDAVDAKAVINAIQEDAKLSAALITARDSKISALEGKARELVEELRGQPTTRACAGSPAIRLLLDRLHGDGTGTAR